ncbi:MAG: glycine cleavage T C-terminal barrel domain-containing protein [Vicinamibacterales bacterium]
MRPLNPYAAARERAGLVDLGARGRIVVRGADRKTFLHALLTNDIALLLPGTGCYAALLTPQGRMIADMNVFELGDVVLVDARREVKDALLQRFDQLIFGEDVQLGDVSDAWGCLGVYGPRAAEIAGGEVGADLAGFGQFQNARLDYRGDLVIAARRDALGLAGFLLFAAPDTISILGEAMQAAGAAVLPEEAVEALRIEAGEPAFLVDMGEDTIPTEAGIEASAVSYLKGCFPGQEVLVRIRDRGHGKVVRKLVGLTIDGEAAPAAGSAIIGGEKEIGHVTSAVVSPALGRPIALGYVHRDFFEPGSAVAMDIGGARVGATVVELPFVR